MLRIDEKGYFKVVDESHLEFHTTSGWRLVGVMDCEGLVQSHDYESAPTQPHHIQQQGSYQPPVQSIQLQHTRTHVVKTSKFLIRLDEDTVLQNLRAEITQLEEKIAGVPDIEKRLTALKSEKATAEGQLATCTASRDRIHRECEALQKEFFVYKEQVAEKLKQADAVLLRENERRRTAYERVVQGEYDDTVETVETGSGG